MTLLHVVSTLAIMLAPLPLQTISCQEWLSTKKSENTLIAVVHLTINIISSNYQHLLVVFTAAISPIIPSTHYCWHTSQIIIYNYTFVVLEMAWVSWILACSCSLSHLFSFYNNYTCRRVKWGEHGTYATFSYPSVTTATHLNSRIYFLTPEHWV